MIYTPEHIDTLKPNEIFVFGSNEFGRHGSGSAKKALEFGAQHGVPIGLCGQTYGIVTMGSLGFIQRQIEVMYYFAELRPELTFLVTKIGTGIAGYTVEEIHKLFVSLDKPENVILPKEFTR